MDAKSLAALADQYFHAREERLAMGKELAKLEGVERELKYKLLAYCEQEEVSAIGGSVCMVKYKCTNEPHVTDWEALHSYIIENDAWDLMQKRVGAGAVKLRWAEDLEIPGISPYPVGKLSVSKV